MYVGYQIHFSNLSHNATWGNHPMYVRSHANFQFVLWNHCFIASGTLVKLCYLFRLHYEKSSRNCVGWCFPYCIMRIIRETVLINKGVRMCLGFQSKPCFSHTRSTRETTEVLRFSIGCCPTSSVVWLFYWLLPDLAFTGNGQPLEGRTTNPKGYSGVTHTHTNTQQTYGGWRLGGVPRPEGA